MPIRRTYCVGYILISTVKHIVQLFNGLSDCFSTCVAGVTSAQVVKSTKEKSLAVPAHAAALKTLVLMLMYFCSEQLNNTSAATGSDTNLFPIKHPWLLILVVSF